MTTKWFVNYFEYFMIFILLCIMLTQGKPVTNPPASKPTTKDNITTNEVIDYLTRFGYLLEKRPDKLKHPSSTKTAVNKNTTTVRTNNVLINGTVQNNQTIEPYSLAEVELAIREFQSFFNIAVTGYMDKVSAKKIREPRCGVQDRHARDTKGLMVRLSPSGRRKRRSLNMFHKFAYAWTDLTWSFDNSTEPDGKHINLINVFYLIEHGLNTWAKVTNVRFEKIPHIPYVLADIVFSFHAGHHGHASAFDGPQGVVAHTIDHPKDKTKKEVHFDKVEPWLYSAKTISDIKTPGGVPDFVHTVIHEVGHALGLKHDTKPDSTMHPLLKVPHPPNKEYEIDPQSVADVQRIYGACSPQRIHSAFSDLSNGNTYLVVQPYIYRIDDGPLKVKNGWPKLIDDEYPTLRAHGKVDEVLCNIEKDLNSKNHRDTSRLYFFMGTKYTAKYYEQFISTKEISEGWPGLPKNTSIDAAFIHTDRRTYIFINDLVYRWDPKVKVAGQYGFPRGAVEKGWPKKIVDVFPGAPIGRIDTVFRWYYTGQVLLFQNNFFYVWQKNKSKGRMEFDGPYGVKQWENVCDMKTCRQGRCVSWTNY